MKRKKTGKITYKAKKRCIFVAIIYRYKKYKYTKKLNSSKKTFAMILSKQIAVSINLTACKLKQYLASILRQQNVDITPEQLLLLDILWNEGTMTQQRLADTMMKDKNSITKLIDGLERRKLVERKQSTTDRRANNVILTKKANAIKNERKEKGIIMLDNMINGISEEELQAFLSTLNKLSNNMTKNGKTVQSE